MANDDLQSPWHYFIGETFRDEYIIDIGAGRGLSKERMSVNGNVVITQDIDRSLLNNVDLIIDTREMCLSKEYRDRFTLVTCFDVVEHIPNPKVFLLYLRDLSKYPIRMFLTTPNYYSYPRDWHYTSVQFLNLVISSNFYFRYYKLRLFLRYKGSDYDIIEEVDEGHFLIDRKSHALGIYIETY